MASYWHRSETQNNEFSFEQVIGGEPQRVSEKMKKKILLVDDDHFFRICQAIFQRDGVEVESPLLMDPEDWDPKCYRLVIGSYPMAAPFFLRISEWQTPIFILSDGLSRDLISLMKQMPKAHFFLKPLDFEKFREMVCDIVCRD